MSFTFFLTVRSSICGTYEYMSPEIVYQQSHGFAVDIWCLGILFYEMLHGSPPFKGENIDDIKKEFKNKKIQISSKFSQETKNLINQLLDFDSRTRINIDQILDHAVFKKNKRHIERPITQQEYNLLIKYYYMNSGGNRLVTHNSTFARQLKRDSMLSISTSNSRRNSQVLLNSPQSPFGLQDDYSDHDFFNNEDEFINEEEPINNFEKKPSENDFKPISFQSPNLKNLKNENINNFQPSKFMSPSEVPPHLISNFKKKDKADNTNVSNYHPPAYSKNNEQTDSLKNSMKRKNSSLTKKLQILQKKNKSNLKNSLFLMNKKESLQKYEKRQNYFTASSSGIKKILSRINSNNKDKIPIRSISLRKLHNDNSLTNNLSKLLLPKKKNNTNNYSSNISKNLTLSQYQQRYNSNMSISTKKIKKSTEKPKTLKRDTSQSIERKLETRVIKASASLPKTLHGFNKQSKKVPLLTLVKKDDHKKLFENIRQNHKFINPQFKSTKNNTFKNSSKKILVNDPIPEELYLSNFDTIKDKNTKPMAVHNYSSVQAKTNSSSTIVSKQENKASLTKLNIGEQDYQSKSPIVNNIGSSVSKLSSISDLSSLNTNRSVKVKLDTIKLSQENVERSFVDDNSSVVSKSKSIFMNYDFDEHKTIEQLTPITNKGNLISNQNKPQNIVKSINSLPHLINNDVERKVSTNNINRNSEKIENPNIISIRKEFDGEDSSYKNPKKLSKILEETESLTQRTMTKELDLKTNNLKDDRLLNNNNFSRSPIIENMSLKAPSKVNYIRRIVIINGVKQEKLIKHVNDQSSENNSNKDPISRNSFKPSIQSQKLDNSEKQNNLNYSQNKQFNMTHDNSSIIKSNTYQNNGSNRIILNSYQNSNMTNKNKNEFNKNSINHSTMIKSDQYEKNVEINHSQPRPNYQCVKFEDSFILNPDEISYIQPDKNEKNSNKNMSNILSGLTNKNISELNSSHFHTISTHKKNNNSENSKILEQDHLKYSEPTSNLENRKSNISVTSSSNAGRVVRKLYLDKKIKRESDTAEIDQSFSKYNMWENFDFPNPNMEDENSKINIQKTPYQEKAELGKSSPLRIERNSTQISNVINIKQLPGLKESNSLGKLHSYRNYSKSNMKNKSTLQNTKKEEAKHVRNHSINIKPSIISRSISKSRLTKVIDIQGNVKYKLINDSTVSGTKNDLHSSKSNVLKNLNSKNNQQPSLRSQLRAS